MAGNARARARGTRRPARAGRDGGAHPRPRNNRDRIVETAVALLNEHGEAAVGTARIAQALGISPGNLYYHFQNREEIVRAIFPRIEAGLADALTPAPDVTGPALLAGHYFGGFRVMYEYRFFFCGLSSLLRSDDELRERYLALETRCLARIRAIIKTTLADGGAPTPPTAAELQRVTTTTWLVFLSWLDYVCLRKRTSELEFEDVASGLEHVFSLLAPWLDAPYRRAVWRALRQMFEAEEARGRRDAG